METHCSRIRCLVEYHWNAVLVYKQYYMHRLPLLTRVVELGLATNRYITAFNIVLKQTIQINLRQVSRRATYQSPYCLQSNPHNHRTLKFRCSYNFGNFECPTLKSPANRWLQVLYEKNEALKDPVLISISDRDRYT